MTTQRMGFALLVLTVGIVIAPASSGLSTLLMVAAVPLASVVIVRLWWL